LSSENRKHIEINRKWCVCVCVRCHIVASINQLFSIQVSKYTCYNESEIERYAHLVTWFIETDKKIIRHIFSLLNEIFR
jgi:hypothetical protein